MKVLVGGPLLIFLVLCTASLADSDDLKVMDYDGYFDQEYHSGYFSKYHENPYFMRPGNAEQAFDAIVQGENVDLAYICSWDLIKWIESGLIEPWDSGRALRTGFGTHDLDLSQQVDALAPYIVPFAFGRMLPVYNSAQVPQSDVKGLGIFLDHRYEGQIALPADSIHLFGLALLATGIHDWSAVSEEQYTAAIDWLRMAHGNQPRYYDEYYTLIESLKNGEILVAWAWSGVGFLAKNDTQSVKFVHEPTEGTAAYICGYANVKGPAGDSVRAYDFANSVSSADPADILLQWGDGLPDSDVMRSRLSEDEIFDLGVTIPRGPMLFLAGLPLEIQERATIDVAEIKSGY